MYCCLGQIDCSGTLIPSQNLGKAVALAEVSGAYFQVKLVLYFVLVDGLLPN